MKTLKITLKGLTPLLMHSCDGVNPLHPITREMKKYTSKRTKTEEDLATISDLEWESGLYYDDNIGVYIPAENIEASFIEGAKATKKGKDLQKYCSVLDFRVPLEYGCTKTKDELKADMSFRDVRAVNIMRSKVIRTRPRFSSWKITFKYAYDETKIDLDTIKNTIEYAGRYVGMCDNRPKYGKFSSVIEELD